MRSFGLSPIPAVAGDPRQALLPGRPDHRTDHLRRDFSTVLCSARARARQSSPGHRGTATRLGLVISTSPHQVRVEPTRSHGSSFQRCISVATLKIFSTNPREHRSRGFVRLTAQRALMPGHRRSDATSGACGRVGRGLRFLSSGGSLHVSTALLPPPVQPSGCVGRLAHEMATHRCSRRRSTATRDSPVPLPVPRSVRMPAFVRTSARLTVSRRSEVC